MIAKVLTTALLAPLALAVCVAAQAPAGPHGAGGPPDGPPPPAPRLDINFPPPPDPLTQEYVAQKFIYSLLAGQIDTLRPLFEEDVREYLTEDLMERLRSQFNWFYGMVGGEFVEFYASGSDSAYFREYRLANESNARSPLIVVQVVFPDSTKPSLIGAQVKNFLGGNEKRLAGEQTWTIKGKKFDIHSVIMVNIDTSSVVAVQFYDETTDTLTQESVLKVGVPLVKELFARGYIDSARTVAGTQKLLDRVGVTFIRRDPVQGMSHVRVGFGPDDFGEFPAEGKPKAAPSKKTTPPKKKTPAQ
jgi:hypothetical protein